jgi:hypothetical protein
LGLFFSASVELNKSALMFKNHLTRKKEVDTTGAIRNYGMISHPLYFR